MRLPLFLLALALVLAFATTADAAVRYADPAGSTEGGCGATEAPCTFRRAVEGAVSGDEVIVGPGTYDEPETVARVEGVSIHGDYSAPMPRVVSPGGFTMRGDVSLGWLEIESTLSDAIECFGDSSIERVRAISAGGSGIELRDGCDVYDSFAYGSGPEPSGIKVLSFEETGRTPFVSTIANSTVIGAGAEAAGITAATWSEARPYEVEVDDTIASGTGFDLETKTIPGEKGNQSPVTMTATYSNFDTKQAEGASMILNGGGNQSAAPLFVDPVIGDYTEAAGSPTIDSGATGPETPVLDLGGNPRVAGNGIDIGAYEYVPPPVPVPEPEPVPVEPAPAPPSSSPPPQPAPAETVARVPAPIVDALAVSPDTFRAAGGGPSVTAVAGKGHPPVGSAVGFSLNVSAPVTFTIARVTSGRRAGDKCVEETDANEGRPKCLRLLPVKGSFVYAGAAGVNSFAFSGRLDGKALKPGAYRLTATAGSSTASAKFTILK